MFRARLHFWLVNAGFWFAVAMLLAAQLYLEAPRTFDRSGGFPVLLENQLIRAAFWAVFTPLVFRLGERFPLRGRYRWPNLGLHLLFSVLALPVSYMLRTISADYGTFLQLGPVQFFHLYMGIIPGRNLIDIAIYWGVFFVGYTREVVAQRQEAVSREATVRAQVTEAELRAIKYQLKPHFVFNSLNAVAALIREERYQKAIETLAELSALMRTLSDSPGRDRVPLADEIAFVERLLAIEKVRFGDKLAVEIDVPAEVRQAQVPSLILQPLVENAIKHGISRRVRPGRVIVRARAIEDGTRLRLDVVNDGPPPRPDRDGTVVNGVGLNATHHRLSRLYGSSAEFRANLDVEEGATVTLILPLQLLPSPLPIPATL